MAKLHSDTDLQNSYERRQNIPQQQLVAGEIQVDTRNSFGRFRGLMFRHRGALFVLLSALLSGLHSLLVKLVSKDLHFMQVSFTRYLLQLVVPIPVLAYQGVSPRPPSWTSFLLICLRGCLGTVALTSLFYSFYNMSIGNSTAIVFGSPVFVGIFARIFLKEAFGVVDCILVLVAISGIFLISQPPFLFGDEDNDDEVSKEFIGALCAALTCLCISLTTVINRSLGNMKVNSFVIVLIYAIIASFFTSLLSTILAVWSMPSCGVVRYALVGMGICNSAGQCLITYSLSVEKSVYVSLLRTNEVIFVFILEFCLFGVIPEWLTLIGAALILLASVTASLKKIWHAKQKRSVIERNDNMLQESTVALETM